MALIRWQPRGQRVSSSRNRDEVDALFDEFFNRGFSPWFRPRAVAASLYPRVDLQDREKEIVLRAEVPGLTKGQLSITINKDVVTLKGEKNIEKETEDECFYCKETSSGNFERQIPLPQNVAADGAEAHLQDGVLTLRLPKHEPAGAVKVSVN